MTTNELRQKFLDYFQNKQHQPVTSSSLVPSNDPTLLFTNAGMVQFKEVFLGLDKRSYDRAVSSQRCVRAGGKHNDLENVGYTARHHTFFEMLGNFSFGDYFKREAIQYAWDFLTNELELPKERLWVTVFEDDDEAADIWLNEIGIDRSRFSRCGEKDNFWAMGDTGPCGPCSEIFYDHGEHIEGGPPGSPEQEGDRYVEIWNLVFMQYDRDGDGNLNPIPKPSVDTGMGLERIAAVMQGVQNNYDIDLFQQLIAAIHELADTDKPDITSSRVIADHIRSCAFLISDGVVPSNEGRGYVLRRIIRRAARHGNSLGFTEPFFYRLVSTVSDLMGEAFPELKEAQEFVERTIKQEELRFAETLDQGLGHLEDILANLKGKIIAGDDVFKLYDTYGFPVDLTADIARERGLTLDKQGFDKAMAEQRKRARAASKFELDTNDANSQIIFDSEFVGYEKLEESSTVIALFKDGRSVKQLAQGEEGGIILATTPFYAESGGQSGDRGKLMSNGVVFEVCDTQKQSKAHIHLGELKQGEIEVGQSLQARVNKLHRVDIMRNHSATHLLHAALRQILGKHVTQKGSLVAADRLRFDFSHPEALTDDEVRKIEQLTNHIILENAATQVDVMSLDEAMESGAMSLFGEKYDSEVRVLNIGAGFSTELCGGTHVLHSGDIGLFKIISETGIAAGVRRIEAVTGQGALGWVDESESRLNRIAKTLKSDRENIESRLEIVLDRSRKLEKEVEQLKSKLASSAGDDMVSDAEEINGIMVLAKHLDGADPKTLRETVDQLKNKLGTAALVLATVKEGKVSLVAGVSKDATDRIKAGELVNFVAQQVGGKGGGRADMAQAGGSDPKGLDSALASVSDWVKQQINS
ncbi:MAG: alanine--tRNA ligase [Gammaproteobacteria bacterium]|jgi:alanyl-tRNA synthetase|nr:alanine--tRNA ligase [Gammaproteobacteria bacterium]